MTPADLAAAVLAAARTVFAARGLDLELLSGQATTVERPRNPEHGDYASTLALQLSRQAGLPSREMAAALADELAHQPGIKSVEVAGQGFLNIRLDAAAAGSLARVVVTEGVRYGHSDTLDGQTINLEFVSANPTGPIHLGHTRWAAVGDSLRRILAAAGAQVASEHYINDAGAQVDRFARSILAAARGEPTPPDGYPGEYVTEIAEQILAEHPLGAARARPADVCSRPRATALMLAEMKAQPGALRRPL